MHRWGWLWLGELPPCVFNTAAKAWGISEGQFTSWIVLQRWKLHPLEKKKSVSPLQGLRVIVIFSSFCSFSAIIIVIMVILSLQISNPAEPFQYPGTLLSALGTRAYYLIVTAFVWVRNHFYFYTERKLKDA